MHQCGLRIDMKKEELDFLQFNNYGQLLPILDKDLLGDFDRLRLDELYWEADP